MFTMADSMFLRLLPPALEIILTITIEFAGTMFREPIMCKNIPRLVPGDHYSFSNRYSFILSNSFSWFKIGYTTPSNGAS